MTSSIISSPRERIKNFPSYTKRGIWDKTKWIILPFSMNLKEKILVDAMYYPQRFIASLICGIAIFLYFVILLYNVANQLIDK